MSMIEQAAMEAEWEPIAIVAMSCRFPGADDIDAFWRMLRDGEETIRFFSDAELLAAGVDVGLLKHPDYVKAKGMVTGIEDFDAHLFGYTPKEAEWMDPQQRLLLECAWQLLEQAALDPDRYQGLCAVYAGVGMNIYLLNNLLASFSQGASPDFYQMLIGSDKDFAATRLSYKLNLKGPSVSVNTACSTSLVAVHTACQSLWDFQCDAAIAGGATLLVPQQTGYLYQQGGIPSPDGHCRPFDAGANGTVPSSGAGLVLLKRLGDALKDKDTIFAVIKGSAINNDGADKIGFTAPSVNGQAAVIAEAMAAADVLPETIGYIEAHGTATPLGDPIEIAALKLAFADDTLAQHCALGSVKGNIGHTDTAAGIAGLIKTALALYHRQLPPSLHYSEANPAIDFATGPFHVNSRLQPWPESAAPRRAGVSSFGIGGTNAHIVLEEAPETMPASISPRAWQLLPLSAKSPQALQELSTALARQLQDNKALDCADVAYSLAVGRRELALRKCVVAGNAGQAVAGLNETGYQQAADAPVIVFMFPGQGAPLLGMGAELYRSESVFKAQVDDCCDRLLPLLGMDLRQLLFPAAGHEAAAEAQLLTTQYAQPALFVIEYALAQLFMAWNIKPAAMIGHSLGEYVAACIAGVFSLQDALSLVSARARLMQASEVGAMLAVMASEARCQAWLVDGLALAAVNADAQCVISGNQQAIDALQSRLNAEGISCKPLAVAHAFHSPLMRQAAASFGTALANVNMADNRIPYLSNVSGDWLDSRDLSLDYWQRHLLQPVQFASGIKRLCAEFKHLVLLEMGPGQALQGLVKPVLQDRQRCLGCLPVGSHATVLQTLAELWCSGVNVDWLRFYQAEQRQRLRLPTYPFQRQRCWVDATPAPPCAEQAPVATEDLSHWFAAVNWKRIPRPVGKSATADTVLVFDSPEAMAYPPQQPVIRITQGDYYQQFSASEFRLNPEQEQDFEHLFKALPWSSLQSLDVVYAWSIQAEANSAELGGVYFGLLNFCKVLAREHNAVQCRMTVLTRGLFDVTGGETRLNPMQALALGPVKVVPQEYPQIRCRLLDLDPDQPDLPDILIGEGEAVLASRHGHYWSPLLDSVVLDDVPGAEDLIKPQGVYLITGGLGGIGMSIAGFLARRYQATLLLTTRQPFPDNSAWSGLLKDAGLNEAVNFAALKAKLAHEQQALEAELSIPGLNSYPGLKDQLEQLCSLYLLDFFDGAGVAPHGGQIWALDALRAQLGVLPKFDKFLLLLLEILQRDGLILHAADQFSFTLPAARPWAQDIAALEQRINEQFPGFRPLYEMVAYCVRHYREALSGSISAISVLYPDGDRSLISETGRNTVEHSNHRVYYQLLKKHVDDIVDASAEVVRILEIGGGSGVLTGIIAPGLKGKNVEYYFTDIGKSFVLKVQQQAASLGLDFMRFGVFDIFQDPVAQGFDLQSFDLIYGLDVVHATPDIRRAIDCVSRLLKPGGELCLVETPPIPRWYEMVWGLAEGWWYFEDAELRSGTTPLLSPDAWEHVMNADGLFAHVAVFPLTPQQRLDTDCCLVVAKMPGAGKLGGVRDRAETIRALLDMERAGAKVHVHTVDVCDTAAMQKLAQQAGAINGVFHTAASDSRGYIAIQDRQRSLAELRPKVLGTLALQRSIDFKSVDFVLLFSSLNAITGGQGNIAYTAANSYLDAFAHYCRHQDLGRVHVLDWDRWQSIGQALAFEERVLNSSGLKLEGGITDTEGFAAIRRALRSPYPQLLVRTNRAAGVEPQMNPAHDADVPQQTVQQRPHGLQAYRAPETATEHMIAEVWSEVLGIKQPGVDDDFAALGGDSLIAIRVMSRLKTSLAMNLEVKLAFEYATIAKLARQIETLQAAVAITTVSGDDDETEYEGGVI
ncbi:MAG: beta-ketoacyl synthase N-terminal-like domain-containing protein [Methylovulum sp.]|nr:beta-ketoacyl synthase N-terminal-like domain-containing protein [Methylovulum sp.]